MVKEALAVDREILLKNREFQGVVSHGYCDFLSTIKSNYKYHERGETLENDESIKQVIPYICVINPIERKIFAYRRSPGKNYQEKRLRDKWSFGVGGHIDREDVGDHITGALREMSEEIKTRDNPEPRIVGYINDDSDSVGRVHFAILAIAETKYEVEKGDDEMAEGRLMTIGEMENLLANPELGFDNWTRLAWPFIRNYIQRI